MSDPAQPDPQPLPRPVVLGVVPYLNVQPLIWVFRNGSDGRGGPAPRIIPARPRELAGRLRAGEFDAGMVPVYEYFGGGPRYTVVRGACIATRGAVGSVMLYSETPLERVHTILLDPASLTSVNLCRVLMAERGLSVRFEEPPPDQQDRTPLDGVARLLIGDPAIAERGRHRHETDLGSLWHAETGLPFVFAAWLAHPRAADLPLNDLLTDARRVGMEHLDEVARLAPEFGTTPEYAMRYFRENMAYDPGEAELRGMELYGRLLAKHGLAPPADGPIRLHPL